MIFQAQTFIMPGIQCISMNDLWCSSGLRLILWVEDMSVRILMESIFWLATSSHAKLFKRLLILIFFLKFSEFGKIRQSKGGGWDNGIISWKWDNGWIWGSWTIQRNQTSNGGNLRKSNKIPSKFKFKKVGQLHEFEGGWRKMRTMDDLVEVGPSNVVRQWMKLHILIGQSKKLGHWMNIGKLDNPRRWEREWNLGKLDNLTI